jgi:hypothetical protein
MVSMMGCDRSGEHIVPQPGNFDAVIEIGKMGVISQGDLALLRAEPTSPKQWCDDSAENGERLCYYGILGQAETGVKGGATFTFEGTGSEVCLVVDPETVFWNTAVAAQRPTKEYRYPDLEEDDGDIDLFAGLSSYYTGSPGVEVGDFKGYYTDSLGSQVEIEYGECFQYGSQSGMNNAHAGRAAVEYCTINTDNRVGVEYTVVLESFSLPLDDAGLGFGALVLDGACGESVVAVDECMLYGESLSSDGGIEDAYTRACTVQLERAACDGMLLEFCCLHPEMCGEDAPDTVCRAVESTLEGFCSSSDTSQYCCE